MPDPSLGLAMIVRDAEAGLKACLDSVAPYVDQIVIVLAGRSKDKTERIARRYTAEVYAFEWRDDFSAARNYAFSFLKTDWAIWLDHDDILQGGDQLRSLIREGEARNFGCFHLPYDYRHDEAGNVTVVHLRERLLRLSLGWRWVCRVHEYAKTEKEHLVGTSDEVRVKHTVNKANTERNLRLLTLMEREIGEDDPEYARLQGLFQDIYQSNGEWLKSIEYGERHFAAVQGDDIRWTAATELSRSYQALADWPLSVHWAHVAASIQPAYALPYLLLAHAAWFGTRDSAKALLYLRDAEDRLEAPLNIFRQPQDYTLRRWDIEHRCLADQGRWQEALAVVNQALSSSLPEKQKEGWWRFVWLYQERLNCERSLQGLQALADHFCQRGDTLHAKKLLDECVPVSLRSDRRLLAMRQRIGQLTAHVFDDEKYDRFYNENHSSLDDPHHALNATRPEPFRLDPLIRRLRRRGAKRILDVGCGAGEPAIYLAKAGFSVTGIDINKAAVKEAAKRARAAFLGNGRSPLLPVFRVGSLETLGPEDLGRFDAVVMMELIEHVTPSRARYLLSAAEDCLVEGGAVFLTTPAMACGDLSPLWQEGFRDHVYEYDRAELEGLFVAPGKRMRLPMTLHRVYDETAHSPGFASWLFEYEIHTERPAWPAFEQPVVIYAGEGLEEWTPETPDTQGLAGSETWCIKVARELRALGHPVAVYAAADGVWDGVIYRHASLFKPEAPFAGERAWLCIISRRLDMLDIRPNAEHVLFMAHDTDYGDNLTAERLANLDSYCILSKWQRRHLESVYADQPFYASLRKKLRMTANGIEPQHFEGSEERKPHSFLWASSPDRGLDRLLEWWPRIRELWPDATLRCAYGWENVDALIGPARPWLAPFKERMLQLLRQPGVTWLGRLSQPALAREWLRSQFWLYPSSLPAELGGGPWHETFAITALEAQAGGCIPIVPSCGALPERIELGVVLAGEEMRLEDALETLREMDGRPAQPLILPAWSWSAAARSLLDCIAVKGKEKVGASSK